MTIYRYKLAAQRARIMQALKDAAYGKITQEEASYTIEECALKLRMKIDLNQTMMELESNVANLEIVESEITQ